jgi:hypothetical protein
MVMPGGMSKYFPEILRLAQSTSAKAVYVFVVDGDRGSGGQPFIMGMPEYDEYLRRNVELVKMLRRSADLLEQDVGLSSRTYTVPWLGERDELAGFWIHLMNEAVLVLYEHGMCSPAELARLLSDRPMHIHGGDAAPVCMEVTPQMALAVMGLLKGFGYVSKVPPMSEGGEA